MNKKEEEKKGDTTDKLTTVGGQSDRKDFPAFSTNIEKVLLKAVEDEEFRDMLFKDRKSALENSGLPLSPQDKMLLQNIPAPTLTATLTSLMKSKLTSRRTFLKASAAGFGFMVGSFLGTPTMEAKRGLECYNHKSEIVEALRAYAADNNGNYPVSLEQLKQISPSSHKPYMEKIPTCPVGNTPYIYKLHNPLQATVFLVKCNNEIQHRMFFTLVSDILTFGQGFYQLTAGIR